MSATAKLAWRRSFTTSGPLGLEQPATAAAASAGFNKRGDRAPRSSPVGKNCLMSIEKLQFLPPQQLRFASYFIVFELAHDLLQ
jgi:hypothetical protein